MARVDQLAAELGLLTVRPEARAELRPVGVHPSAEPRGGLVDVAGDSRILERERAREAGDAAADDGDPRRCGGTCAVREHRRPGEREGAEGCAASEEITAGHDRRCLALTKLVDLDPEPAGFGVVPGEALHGAHQR